MIDWPLQILNNLIMIEEFFLKSRLNLAIITLVQEYEFEINPKHLYLANICLGFMYLYIVPKTLTV